MALRSLGLVPGPPRSFVDCSRKRGTASARWEMTNVGKPLNRSGGFETSSQSDRRAEDCMRYAIGVLNRAGIVFKMPDRI